MKTEEQVFSAMSYDMPYKGRGCFIDGKIGFELEKAAEESNKGGHE